MASSLSRRPVKPLAGSAHEVVRKERRKPTFIDKIVSFQWDRFFTPVVFVALMYALHYAIQRSGLLDNTHNNHHSSHGSHSNRNEVSEKQDPRNSIVREYMNKRKKNYELRSETIEGEGEGGEEEGEELMIEGRNTRSVSWDNSNESNDQTMQAAASGCYEDEDGIEYCLPRIIGVCCVRSGSTALSQYMNAHPFLSYGIPPFSHSLSPTHSL
jgi:hypothetical protein